jgi:alpha-beta hydrolase superfamily lysophospholipase
LIPVSDWLIIKPKRLDQKKYDQWIAHPFIVNEKIHTQDGETLDVMFYNANKIPTYEDEVIYMYSHGNSGWSGLVLESATCTYLANRGSVFVYDYRGYGKSTGYASSIGCMRDSVDVYKYLVNTKKVNHKKIILFGHSMGACVTSYLMNYLSHNNIPYPKVMIIQNAFENIQRACNDTVPFSGRFIVSDMKTDNYIKKIDKLKDDIDILILHSKDDKVIHPSHSADLAKHVKNNRIKFILLEGTHDNPVYDESFDRYVKMIKDL